MDGAVTNRVRDNNYTSTPRLNLNLTLSVQRPHCFNAIPEVQVY